MVTIVAVTPKSIQEDVINKLGRAEIDGLNWQLLRGDEQTERVVPAWPVQDTATGLTPVGGVVEHTDISGETRLDLADLHLDDDTEAWFAQELNHGATVLIVETPDEREEDVITMLDDAGVRRFAQE